MLILLKKSIRSLYVIRNQSFKKVYKDVTTVDIEKITVREGEIYGFLGPNGAGKTTTMKMILSLVTRLQVKFLLIKRHSK